MTAVAVATPSATEAETRHEWRMLAQIIRVRVRDCVGVEPLDWDICAARYHRQGLPQSVRSTPIGRVATGEARVLERIPSYMGCNVMPVLSRLLPGGGHVTGD
jgi:hypothetical protein